MSRSSGVFEVPMGKSLLLALLRDPETVGKRGDVVWALREGKYDCSDRETVLLLFECVLSGTYEEVDHAMAILGDLDCDVPMPSEVVGRLQCAVDAGGWRGEAAELALYEWVD